MEASGSTPSLAGQAQNRILHKIEMGAGAGLAGGLLLASRSKGPPLVFALSTATSVVTGTAIFSALQEGVRAARGVHDAWNSTAAGALAGGFVVGLHAGPRYRLFGALSWGAICGACHLLHNAVQPRQLLERVLIHADLLDPPEQRTTQLGSTPTVSTSGTTSTSTSGPEVPTTSTKTEIHIREKLHVVRQIRAKEMEEIRSTYGQQQQPSSRGQAAGHPQGSEDDDSVAGQCHDAADAAGKSSLTGGSSSSAGERGGTAHGASGSWWGWLKR